MIVLVHNILAPYRISLFNAIHDASGGQFVVLLTRLNYPRRRRWSVPLEQAQFPMEVLQTGGFEFGERAYDVSLGVSAALDRLAPDILVVNGWNVLASWAALAWARRHGIPAYGWVETSQSSGTHRGAMSTALRRRFLSSLEGVIVPGAEAERYLKELRPDVRCTRMPNSVDVPDLRRLDTPPEAGSLLFVGELSLRKGVDLLLGAADELLEAFPTITVVGDGPLRPAVDAAAKRRPAIRWLGFAEGRDRTRAMEGAVVLALPSRRDPWPLVPCEAIVAGRPVVLGTGVSSAPELKVVGGDAVVVMASADAVGLVSAARQAKKTVVNPLARASFTPLQSARAFLSAVKQ